MLRAEKGLLGQRAGILAEIRSNPLESAKTGGVPATLSRRLHDYSTHQRAKRRRAREDV